MQGSEDQAQLEQNVFFHSRRGVQLGLLQQKDEVEPPGGSTPSWIETCIAKVG